MTGFHVLVRRTGATVVLQRHSFELSNGAEIGFGRSSDNEIAIADPDKQVSSRHGRIECRPDGSLWALDSGSLNGTFHNGSAITAGDGVRLAAGDVLRVGDFELHVQVTARAEHEPAFEGTIVSALGPHVRERSPQPPEPVAVAAVARDEDLATVPLPPATTSATASASASAPASDAHAQAMRWLAARFVPNATLSDADVHRFAALVHQTCTAGLGWVARCLQARSVFAQEFAAEVTMLFQRGSNPLKGLDAGGLAAHLLDWRVAEGADRRQQLLDAVLTDLAEHQLGVLAGVRDAIGSVIARLAPDRIEALAKNSGGWSRSAKAAHAWTTYQQLYAETFGERGKLFDEVISPAIQQGYLHQHDKEAPADGSAARDRKEKQ